MYVSTYAPGFVSCKKYVCNDLKKVLSFYHQRALCADFPPKKEEQKLWTAFFHCVIQFLFVCGTFYKTFFI